MQYTRWIFNPAGVGDVFRGRGGWCGPMLPKKSQDQL